MTSLLEQVAALSDEDWGGSNPLSATFRDNPYPGLKLLRETDPVNLTPLGVWRLTRYADILEIFKQAPVAQTLADGSSPNFDPEDRRGDFHRFMLNLDGPEHLRLRRLVVKAFTGRAVTHMHEVIEGAVDEAIVAALAQGGMDIIHDLALYVPSFVTCRIMGIPDADRLLFLDWAGSRTKAFWARFLPPDQQAEIRAAGVALADYFEDLVRERRKALGDDLLSELIRAEDEGERLHEGELIIQAIGLLVAGYETTIGLIGNGTLAFLRNPAERERLQAEPSLIDQAVDEILRYDPPVVFNWRILREPYTIGGKDLPADSVLWLMLGAGNRDPARFPEPDRFDITRTDAAHLAFGGGPHFCLGNQLAKMEGRAVFSQLFDRLPPLRYDESRIEWSNSFFRVLGHMPVEFV